MHAPRLLLAVLLIAAVALPSARGGVSLVFDITDSDPLSSQQLADALVANYASYGLAITNVTVLGDASVVGVPPLGSQPPTGSPAPTSPSTGSPSAGTAKAPKSSAYLDWAPALIVCVVAAALGAALVVYAIVRRKNKSAPTGQQAMTLALCIMLLCGPHSAHSLSRSYANCRILLPNIDYRVYWNINGNSLEVALQGQSQGWLGLGISTSTQPGSLMDSAGEPPYGSDITVGYVGGDCPNGCAFDYWSTLHERPNLDSAQNVTFVAGAKNATHMTVEYNRPLTTRGDADQDKSIPTNAPVMVIFAANVDESPTAQGTQFSYHGSNRNGMRINFGASSNCDRAYVNLRIQMTLSSPFATFDVGTFFDSLAAKLSVGAERFQFIASDDTSFTCPSCIIDEWVMPNYPVLGSAGVTQFVCHDFAFDVDNTYHAIRFDPIIPASSESIAHHMILYSLGAPTGKTGFWECSNMPPSAAPLSVWAVGAASFILPENVGFPVGKGKTVYATIQMHYNNPALRDFVDASGFRIYRTPVLRPLNGGWAFLGTGLGKINIPAGIPYPPGALVSGNCPATLVNYWTTYGDVHVFAYAMHAHTLARKIQTDHLRGGQRVSMLSNDPYSFSFQHLVMGDWVIKQGDSLNTTCWYDSSSRTVATRGGETSSNEMCFAIVAFYCPDPCPSTFSGGACIV